MCPRDTQSLPARAVVIGLSCWGHVPCKKTLEAVVEGRCCVTDLCDTPLQPLWSVSSRTGIGQERNMELARSLCTQA